MTTPVVTNSLGITDLPGAWDAHTEATYVITVLTLRLYAELIDGSPGLSSATELRIVCEDGRSFYLRLPAGHPSSGLADMDGWVNVYDLDEQLHDSLTDEWPWLWEYMPYSTLDPYADKLEVSKYDGSLEEAVLALDAMRNASRTPAEMREDQAANINNFTSSP